LQLELIEKLADENLYELHVARLLTPTGPRLVSARRLKRQAGAVADMPEKLRRAFTAAAAVQHPHLLPPLGLFEADGSLWWLSARTEGFDLATVFARLASREVRITPPRTLQVGVDLVAGLAALHTAGHAHGGLGPRAALIDPQGVCRLDAVGLEAVLMRERELRRLARRGRAEHLAPEVVQGRGPEAAGDVFAVAALIYQLLTGQPPLGGQQRGMSTRHQAVRPPSKVDRSLPYACDAVFVKALAVAPRQRHADGTALGNAMDQLRRSLSDRPQETRAGVAEFISNLFPNEAKVAGMPGTLQRPARGGALELRPAFAKATEIGRAHV
jgi:serine/threonine protein kinase